MGICRRNRNILKPRDGGKTLSRFTQRLCPHAQDLCRIPPWRRKSGQGVPPLAKKLQGEGKSILYDTRYIEHTPGQAPILRRSLPNQLDSKISVCMPFGFWERTWSRASRVGDIAKWLQASPLWVTLALLSLLLKLWLLVYHFPEVLGGRSRPLTFSSISYSFSFTEVF